AVKDQLAALIEHLQAHLLHARRRGETYLLLLNDNGHLLRSAGSALRRRLLILRRRDWDAKQRAKRTDKKLVNRSHRVLPPRLVAVVSPIRSSGPCPENVDYVFNLYSEECGKHVGKFFSVGAFILRWAFKSR